MNNLIALVGRLLLAVLFIFSGLGKIAAPQQTKQLMTAHGMPFVSLLFILGVVLEIAGGLSLLLGWKTTWGASGLLLFVIVATLVFHTNLSDSMQAIQFLKNGGIAAALLLLAINGPGNFSLDGAKNNR